MAGTKRGLLRGAFLPLLTIYFMCLLRLYGAAAEKGYGQNSVSTQLNC